MRDNMENKGWRERQRVANEEDKEVDFLRRKFGVTSTKVLEAIRAVGSTDREALEEYLRNQIGGYDPKRDAGPRE
ncbi:DUF3606 domain-containing protein [Polluticoccus soli]|uniref:DUF3606 domain-containing protein n=1 Tax=Polluticoccus soli TaxID=3034150 RepID=UPI0023E08F0D|nr:DUF3606 domain-containing protein [Flavipsychrobacter sp. JY13-12]